MTSRLETGNSWTFFYGVPAACLSCLRYNYQDKNNSGPISATICFHIINVVPCYEKKYKRCTFYIHTEQWACSIQDFAFFKPRETVKVRRIALIGVSPNLAGEDVWGGGGHYLYMYKVMWLKLQRSCRLTPGLAGAAQLRAFGNSSYTLTQITRESRAGSTP